MYEIAQSQAKEEKKEEYELDMHIHFQMNMLIHNGLKKK